LRETARFWQRWFQLSPGLAHFQQTGASRAVMSQVQQLFDQFTVRNFQ